jgi:hypothetical protein
MVKKLCIIVIPLMILTFGCKTSQERTGFMVAPVLLSPENGSTVSENPPTFTWQRVEENMYYQIQVTAEGDSGDSYMRWLSIPYGGDTVSFTFDIALPPGVYTWMVCCVADFYT